VYFKLGYIKSKSINFVLFFGIFFGGTILLQELMSDKDNASIQAIQQFLSKQSDILIAVEIFAVMILLLVISYLFSLHNYKKREF
jgi:hypothetical protein